MNILSLSNKEINLINISIFDKRDEIFNLGYLKEQLTKSSYLVDIDLCKLLNISSDKIYTCLFLENNFAWISKSSITSRQRYYSKRKCIYGLDVIDILRIYFNCSPKELPMRIFNELNIITYMDRNSFVDSNALKFEQFLKKNNHSYLLGKFDIYLSLCKAYKDIFIFHNFNNQITNEFYISLRYLKKKYNLTYSISTIGAYINLLITINILERLPEDNIKNQNFEFSKIINNLNNKSAVAVYKLVLFEESKILNNNIEPIISLGKYTKSDFIKLSQKNNVKIHFNSNSGGGDKTKVAKANLKDALKLEPIFIKLLEEAGFISKEIISSYFPLNNTVFNKLLKTKSSELDIIFIKPNKRIKEHLRLSTNEIIAVKKGVKTKDILLIQNYESIINKIINYKE